MMGVGKSTIGKRLAKSLKLKFVDVDKAIEEKEKNTVSEIFNNKGESYFRKIEKKITLEVLKKSELVIALGGGAFINSSIRKEVLNSCTSIWLDLNVKSILLRLKNVNKRPLLNQNNLEKTLNKIYLDRKRIYNESNFRIKCESKNIKVIIDRIIKIYENSKN